MFAAVVLALLVLVAGVGHRAGAAGAVLVAAVSVLWLVVNGPMEGEILLEVTPQDGLTGADLAGLTGLGLAAIQLSQVMRARRRQR